MLHSESVIAKKASVVGSVQYGPMPVGRCCVVLAAACAVLFGGCAMAPGMSSASLSSEVANAGAQVGGVNETGPVAMKPHAQDSGQTTPTAADAPPPDGLIEINSELIEKERAALPKTIPQGVEQLFGTPEPYELGPGDVLNIVVWDHPELNMSTGSGGGQDAGSSSVVSGYTIDSTGSIQVAYVGAVHVAGLTEMEARDFVTEKLSRYLRDPQVTLRIVAYRSKRIYLDGEVRNPGLQVLNDMPMTLPEAINRAGGFTQNGDRSEVSITRGKKTVIVNIPDMIRKGVNPDNIVLQSGDLVRVYSQNDSKVYVLGEVGRPGSVDLNNGRISLNEALGSAGGISQESGDASQVYVVRGGGDGKPTVFHLNADSPTAMAVADGFELKPSDIVFVDASALVRWSRVMNLLLPSTEAAATSRSVGGY